MSNTCLVTKSNTFPWNLFCHEGHEGDNGAPEKRWEHRTDAAKQKHNRKRRRNHIYKCGKPQGCGQHSSHSPKSYGGRIPSTSQDGAHLGTPWPGGVGTGRSHVLITPTAGRAQINTWEGPHLCRATKPKSQLRMFCLDRGPFWGLKAELSLSPSPFQREAGSRTRKKTKFLQKKPHDCPCQQTQG